jgi:hypothetical protein
MDYPARIALLSMVSPFGLIIALAMVSIFLSAHPMIGVVVGGTIALVIIIALHERYRAGRSDSPGCP